MRKMVMSSVVLAAVLSSGCASGPGGTPTPRGGGSSEPGPTLCADLAALVEGARSNFPGLRRQDRPVVVDNVPGFEAAMTLANTAGCRILTSSAPYPDAYECDLAPATSQPTARVIVERWAAVVGACPAVASWTARAPTDAGYAWELELEDNHQLVVTVVTTGEADARPTIVVRMNEI